MRYHFEKPSKTKSLYGRIYFCNHPVYNSCTLYLICGQGLAVIQQRFSRAKKTTWWSEIDPWLTDVLYLHEGFKGYFDEHAGAPSEGLYPTVTVRQIMWALKLKPLRKERWETVFDHKSI